jgi:transposase-like protein
MSGLRYSDAKKQKIYDLYKKNGKTVAAIARMDGMPTEKSIRKILAGYGCSLRGNPQRYDRAAILRDLETKPVSQVAIDHHCSRKLIYRIRHEATAEAETQNSPSKTKTTGTTVRAKKSATKKPAKTSNSTSSHSSLRMMSVKKKNKT